MSEPTKICAVPAAFQQNLMIVSKNLQFSTKMVLISAFMLIIFGGIMAYCIYKMVEVIRFYMQRRAAFEETKKKALSKNMYVDPRNDNEIRTSTSSSEDVSKQQDDYSKITTSIEKSVASYRDYNKKLADYYQNTFSEEAPDKIDRKILMSENDDYK